VKPGYTCAVRYAYARTETFPAQIRARCVSRSETLRVPGKQHRAGTLTARPSPSPEHPPIRGGPTAVHHNHDTPNTGVLPGPIRTEGTMTGFAGVARLYWYCGRRAIAHLAITAVVLAGNAVRWTKAHVP
jgi:hypothetical protein